MDSKGSLYAVIINYMAFIACLSEVEKGQINRKTNKKKLGVFINFIFLSHKKRVAL